MKFFLTVILIVIAGMIMLRGNIKLGNLFSPDRSGMEASLAAAETDRHPKVMMEEVNDLRAQGCRCPDGITYKPAPPLTWNRDLETAALRHARDMAAKNYFSHIGKDGSNFTDRVTRAGYNWQTVAENIAYGYPTAREVVRAWARSNGHCQNLMNPNFNEMGSARQGRYWVQELGARPEVRTAARSER
jgi:uncharacterized protein YkwD